jgi:hypothetical protein
MKDLLGSILGSQLVCLLLDSVLFALIRHLAISSIDLGTSNVLFHASCFAA